MSTRIDTILRIVCSSTGVSKRELLAANRSQKIVNARHVAMWLLRRHTFLSLPAIGRILHRDHSSVLHGVRRVEAELRNDPEGELAQLARSCDARCRLSPLVDQDMEEASLLRSWEPWLAQLRAQGVRRAHARPPAGRRPHHRTAHRIRLPVPDGRPRVHVPRGRTLTAVLMGDPPLERSALWRHRMMKKEERLS